MAELVFGNRYRVLGKIGEGGMAIVYQAEDTLLDRIVAVKVLREQYAGDASFLARFKQEARAAAGLTHQNIVSVYDVGTDQGHHYIVMEYVEGTSLKQLIAQGAPFTNARAVSIALQLLAALSFAHQKGVVHRDVKPQNILVTPEGHVKVADFGIARAVTSVQLTETGTVLGTVHYCSPEQAQGRGVTQASDLYSVGVVLYEMLTGRLPFEGEGALAVALKHLQEEPVEPSRLNPRVSPQLEAIVLKAMAKEPSQRHSSADEMRQELLRYQQLSDQMTSQFAPVPQPPRKVQAEESRRRGFDWVALVLGVMIVAALIFWIPLGNKLYEVFFAPIPASGPATSTPTPSAIVPRLVGLSYSEAERQLEAVGLHIRIAAEEYSDEYEAFLVMSQSVEPESKLEPGSVVYVVVSKGRQWVPVPNVMLQKLGVAREKLEELGLGVRVVEEWHGGVAAGVVFEQEPLANTEVQKGSIVTLRVSKGPEPIPTPTPRPQPTPPPSVPTISPSGKVIVPNVVGMPEEGAKRLIEASRLSNTYTNWQTADDVTDKEYYYSIPVGHVLSQQPPPGTEVEPGRTVYIAVRKN